MWKPEDIGHIVAERELEYKNGRGLRKVILRLGQPVRSPLPEEGDPWWCPIQIEGLEKSIFKTIAGEDALQSLLLALLYAKKMLSDFAKETGGVIYWLAEEMDSIFDQQNMIDVYSMMTAEAFQLFRAVAQQLRGGKTADIHDALEQIEMLLDKYNAKKEK